MSVDTTVVILGREVDDRDAYLPYAGREYTAVVVQAAENLEPAHDWEQGSAIEFALRHMKRGGQPWFRNLGRAKQFAQLLKAEELARYELEYEDILMYLVHARGVFPLTQKGKIAPRAKKRWGLRDNPFYHAMHSPEALRRRNEMLATGGRSHFVS